MKQNQKKVEVDLLNNIFIVLYVHKIRPKRNCQFTLPPPCRPSGYLSSIALCVIHLRVFYLSCRGTLAFSRQSAYLFLISLTPLRESPPSLCHIALDILLFVTRRCRVHREDLDRYTVYSFMN